MASLPRMLAPLELSAKKPDPVRGPAFVISIAQPVHRACTSREQRLATIADRCKSKRSAVAVQRSLRSRGSRSVVALFASLVVLAAAAATAAASAAAVTATAVAMVMMAMAMATVTTTTAAAVATMTGNGNLFTAQQGDADDREKHRDAKNQSTVHPRILQQKNRYLGVTKSQQCRLTKFSPPLVTANKRRSQNSQVLCVSRLSA